ncbi:hypothetical protein GQ53DRAFT_752627 [Thozetella sp. PMI_491]|nr:hypothetical protein GQ53DRAFT_752627 [Thozetella sp. PMI_491]
MASSAFNPTADEADSLFGSNDDTSDDDNPAAAPPLAVAPPRIRIPPADHPIWGTGGIMNGIALNRSGRQQYNPELLDQKRDHKKFGHNRIAVGQWFANQLVACWHGAHGAPVAGISGSQDHGAYSIVISGRYDANGLDSDQGDDIIYTSDGALLDPDPVLGNPRSSKTKSLVRSITTRKPVRVLRSRAKGTTVSQWAPRVGIRYDGLYRVTAVENTTNSQNRPIDRFTLTRLTSQVVNPLSLAQIQSRSPSRRQRNDYDRIKEGY